VERGWEVRATGRRPRAGRLPASVPYRAVDLAEDPPEDLDDLLDGVTHLFHLAGASSSLASGEAMHRSNVVATERLLAASAPDLEHVLYMGSSSVYGEAVQLPQPVTEDVEPHPSRGYGKAKWEAEQVVWRNALEGNGVPTVVVRPVSIYGPGAIRLLASAVLDAAIERFAGHRRLPVHAEPIEQRLVHVADLVAACVHLAEHPETAGRAYNVTGEEYPTNHVLAGILAAELGLELELDPDPECGPPLEERRAAWEAMGARGMDRSILFTDQRFRFMRKANRNNRLSVEALRATGFDFGEDDLATGVGRTIAWYREHGWIA
jgi:nucleoside-diphosphate-sugar epimerase